MTTGITPAGCATSMTAHSASPGLKSAGAVTERWIWVSLPHATYLLGIARGIITDAPPVARWAIGKDERQVAAHLRRRGARIVPLP